jgi:PRTRC genetic system ThiF family protein
MTTQKLIAPTFINEAAEAQRKLLVIVVGAGGTGSALLGKLFQMNSTITKLDGSALDVVVFDDDKVTEANTGRQAFYAFDVGRNKAEVLVERFNQLGCTRWGYVPEKFSADNFEHLIRRDHSGVVIFGCVDNAAGRIQMHKAMKSLRHCIYIDAGNSNRSGHVVVGVNATIGKTKVYYPTVYDLFKTQLDNWQPVEGDSCSHEASIRKQDFGLNDAMALYSTQVLWQLIRHGECAYQSMNVDLETGHTKSFGVDPEYWEMFGYTF